MLWALIVALVVLWFIGLVTQALAGLIHILLLVAAALLAASCAGGSGEAELQAILEGRVVWRGGGGPDGPPTPLLADSFEGNAQTFRILTRLSWRQPTQDTGLNWTLRSLAAVTKYPWLRGGHSRPSLVGKWGAYASEADLLDQVIAHTRQAGLWTGERSLEADVMDWSDDITYAVHDIEDFYRAASIPLAQLRRDDAEWDAHLAFVAADIVNNCNLRCPFCLVDYSGVTKTELMSEETYRSLLRLVDSVPDGQFYLSCLHEPTLHPRLNRFLELIPSASRRKVFFTTNLARPLKAADFEIWARSGLHHINVSFDTMDAERFAVVERAAAAGVVLHTNVLVEAFLGQGKVEAVDPTTNTLTVDGTVLNVTTRTKLTRADKPIKLADIKVGDRVQGTMNTGADGKTEALTIKVAGPDASY